MNTQGGCSERTDWIARLSRSLVRDDEQLRGELEGALRAAYYRGLRDAASDCRQVMDRNDSKRCCQLTVRQCVDEIDKHAA